MVTRSAALIVKHFDQDHYTAVFDTRTGFFVRMEDDGYSEPFWSEHGPELLDVSITNWCDRGCSCCYRRADTSGSHMALVDYEEVLRQAAKLHVFQIALGGGNPNQHPIFAELLQRVRAEYGIVPNYTTNGRGLSERVLTATKKYCGAVAVSAYEPYEETGMAVKKLLDQGVTTNIHFVLSGRSLETAMRWLSEPPRLLEGVNAIVFLNYKPVGRHADNTLLLKSSCRLDEFFRLATAERLPFRVGFDTCMISGLARLGKAHKISLEGCDAGRFSLFVSEKMEVFPCSFMVEAGYRGVSLRSNSLAEIWKTHSSFEAIRASHAAGGCDQCSSRSECLAGCPIFPQMNLCPFRYAGHQQGIAPRVLHG